MLFGKRPTYATGVQTAAPKPVTTGVYIPDNLPSSDGVFSSLANLAERGVKAVGSVAQSAYNRGSEFLQAAEDTAKNPSMALTGEGMLRGAGALGGFVGDTISAVLPQEASDALGYAAKSTVKGVKNAIDTVTGNENVSNAISDVASNAADFAEAHPRIAKDVGAAVDATNLLGIPFGKAAATKVGESAAMKSLEPTLAASRKSVGDLAESQLVNTYKKVLNMTGKAVEAEAEWGKNTPKVLAKKSVPIHVDPTGRLDLSEGIDQLRQAYSERAPKVRELLTDTGQYHSLNDLERNAMDEIEKSFAKKGADKQKAIEQLKKEIGAYKETYAKSGGFSQGDDVLVPTHVLDDIKSGQWDKAFSAKLPNKEEIISNDVNYRLGHQAKRTVEKSVPDAELAKMNSELGDLQQAIKTLQSRNGQLPRAGGVLTKALSSGAGAALGSLLGGVPGFVAGGITGAKLAELVSSRKVPLALWDKVRKSVVSGEESKLVQEADRILQQRAKERMSRKLLPEPSQINLGPPADASRVFSSAEAQSKMGIPEYNNLRGRLDIQSTLNK